MAANQADRHELGRTGEEIASNLVGGKKTPHKAPFDVVDFSLGYAYEVEAMSGLGKDLKIHISNGSYAKKVAFAKKYRLAMLLIVVVIHSPYHIEIYQGDLVQSVRVGQLKKIR